MDHSAHGDSDTFASRNGPSSGKSRDKMRRSEKKEASGGDFVETACQKSQNQSGAVELEQFPWPGTKQICSFAPAQNTSVVGRPSRWSLCRAKRALAWRSLASNEAKRSDAAVFFSASDTAAAQSIRSACIGTAVNAQGFGAERKAIGHAQNRLRKELIGNSPESIAAFFSAF